MKALANEKYKYFKENFPDYKVQISTGDFDKTEKFDSDILVCTAEKLDSVLRHGTHAVRDLGLVIIDEIHLLHDSSRGPVLEILITLLRKLCSDLQIIGLSATIGNPNALAGWLGANLVQDSWRPTRLDLGVYLDGKIEFS